MVRVTWHTQCHCHKHCPAYETQQSACCRQAPTDRWLPVPTDTHIIVTNTVQHTRPNNQRAAGRHRVTAGYLYQRTHTSLSRTLSSIRDPTISVLPAGTDWPLATCTNGHTSLSLTTSTCLTQFSSSFAPNYKLSQQLYMVQVVVWHSGSTLVSINEVNLRRAWLVTGWVTMSGFNS